MFPKKVWNGGLRDGGGIAYTNFIEYEKHNRKERVMGNKTAVS